MNELDGGALGMKLGEHKQPPDVFPGRKFYTIGKARYRPFKVEGHEQRNFLRGAPLPVWTVLQMLEDEGVDEAAILNIRNAWTGYVEAYMTASSGLTPGYYDRGSLPGTLCWDVKLMHQEPIREKDQDINGNLSRTEAIERLRAIRSVLTKYVPQVLLRKMFRGWIHVNLNEVENGNPFVDPFTDMSLADFNSDMNTVPVQIFNAPNFRGVFFNLGQPALQAGDTTTVEGGIDGFIETPVQGIDLMDLADLVKNERDESSSKYLLGGKSGYSKFFDAPTALVASKASIVYETEDAFLFAKENNDKLYITAYGGKSSALRSLVRSLVRDTNHTVFYALVPSAMPATAHGRQECPPGPYPDLDLAKLWVKHFHGTATTELPDRLDEGLRRLLKKQKPGKYELVYAAMRNLKEQLPHSMCEDTGVPHEFWIRCEV